jgi:ribonuclease BN (tRNA processing enzyme)
MRFVALGTAGWVPSERRETTCLALRDGARLLVFDAGTGLRRFLRPAGRELLAGVEGVDLMLTHYHLDHVCGLAYLPAAFAGHDVTIHAPSRELNGWEPEQALGELIRPPYNPGGLSDWPWLSLKEVPPGGAEVAGHRIAVRAQRHPGTSVGYRVDDAFALVTDTSADPETERFARGVGLLAHECWYNASDPATATAPGALLQGYQAHTEAAELGALAARAGVGRLVLTHMNPLYDELYYDRLLQEVRRGFPGALLLPDEAVLDLSGVD